MRQFRALWIEDLLLAQGVPGLFFCAGWTVMYEIYHEDGSFYTTLIQEILGSEGFFPYFLMAVLLMALPVGMVLDAVRAVLLEGRLGAWRRMSDQCAPIPSSLGWMHEAAPLFDHFEERLALYRHAWTTLLVPARAAGNLGLAILVFLCWFVVKAVHMSAWHVFSWLFIIGTPLVGLLIVRALFRRSTSGVREFHRLSREVIFPRPAASAFGAASDPDPCGADLSARTTGQDS